MIESLVLKTAPVLEPITRQRSSRGGKIATSCSYCGAGLLIFRCHMKEHKRHFCKPECYHGWLSENRKGDAHHNWNGGPVQVECAQCGTIILRKKVDTGDHKRHFCGKDCEGKWRSKNLRGAKIYNWTGGVKIPCCQCGKEIIRPISRVKACENHFCSRSCKGKWHSENKCKDKSYQWRGGILALRERLRQDPKNRVNARMAAGIGASLKGNKKGRSWEKLVGYSCEQLMTHLNKTIPHGYTWGDFLAGNLEIDHIIPQVVFNFTSEKDIDFKRCWALVNLQLLYKIDNRKKGARMQVPFQPSLAMQVAI